MRASFGLIVAIALVAASPAQAVFVGFDTTPNNTAATAEPLVSNTADWNAGTCALSADVAIGSLAAGGGDVDFYSITVPNGCIVTAITTPLDPFNNVPDTIAGSFTGGGVLLNDSDDAGADADAAGALGPARGSAVRILNNSGAAATFLIAVTGFDDFDFDGMSDFYSNTIPHSQSGAYALTVSTVPEPATWAALFAGAFCLIRRRR